MRIAHFSDLHVARRPGWGELNPKRLLAAANHAVFRRWRHQEKLAAAAAVDIAARRPDIAIFTGDFSQHGLRSEFAAAGEILSPLIRANIPILAVAGNHDYYGGAVPTGLADLIQHLSLGVHSDGDGIIRLPGVEIALLEQACPTPPLFSSGRQKPEELMLAAPAWRKPPNGVMRILCGHYPVADFRPRDPLLFLRGLHGSENLARFIGLAGAAGYFCGHNHRRFETALTSGCRQYAAPSLSTANSGEAAIYECGPGLAYPSLV
jgi:hypothetical protein